MFFSPNYVKDDHYCIHKNLHVPKTAKIESLLLNQPGSRTGTFSGYCGCWSKNYASFPLVSTVIISFLVQKYEALVMYVKLLIRFFTQKKIKYYSDQLKLNSKNESVDH